jgi:hypothetical protein
MAVTAVAMETTAITVTTAEDRISIFLAAATTEGAMCTAIAIADRKVAGRLTLAVGAAAAIVVAAIVVVDMAVVVGIGNEPHDSLHKNRPD